MWWYYLALVALIGSLVWLVGWKTYLLQIEPLTLRNSLKSLCLRLWDEEAHQLAGWEALRGVMRTPHTPFSRNS